MTPGHDPQRSAAIPVVPTAPMAKPLSRGPSMWTVAYARLARLAGLRYAADLRSLALLALAAVWVYAPFWLDMPTLVAAPWVACSSLLCFIVSVINHNHCHVPLFRSARRNGLISLIFGCVRGHTSTTVIVPHNINHHRYIGGPLDWISPRLAGSGAGWRRLLRFVLLASVNMARERRRPEAPRLSETQRRTLRVETLVLLVCIVFLFYLDSRKALIFVLLPWLGGLLLLVGINLLQHDGCDARSPHGHSRNFTGRWANWFFFNNGYHSMHHRRPELHWRRLPPAHDREIASCLPVHLQQASMLGFLWRHYIVGAGVAPDPAVGASPRGARPRS